MNVLYGVCGYGLGHFGRAIEIIKYLENQGHKVIVLSSGDSYEPLKKDYKVIKVPTTRILFKNGGVSNRKTLFYNVGNSYRIYKFLNKFEKIIDKNPIDVCISDMEPNTNLIAQKYNLPLVTIDNQHFLVNFDHGFSSSKEFSIIKSTTRLLNFNADYNIILSFVKKKIENSYTFLTMPIIRKEVKNLKPVSKNKILVYLHKEYPDIFPILKNINENFIIYGYNTNKKDDNLEFKTKESFIDDLRDCKAIIANSGFSLISEAIYLKKPYFALPLKGQAEQQLNSIYLEELGFGKYSCNLNEKEVEDFLLRLDFYKSQLKNYEIDYENYKVVINKVLKKIKNKEYFKDRRSIIKKINEGINIFKLILLVLILDY